MHVAAIIDARATYMMVHLTAPFSVHYDTYCQYIQLFYFGFMLLSAAKSSILENVLPLLIVTVPTLSLIVSVATRLPPATTDYGHCRAYNI